MLEVHARMTRPAGQLGAASQARANQSGASVLDQVAEGILENTRLLCLDEVEGELRVVTPRSAGLRVQRSSVCYDALAGSWNHGD
eukprot:1195464-Prorocentrum_minimum.AAC.1